MSRVRHDSVRLDMEKGGSNLRALERRISGQNKAGESYDCDSALYNDTSRYGDGAFKAGGTPMRHIPGAGAGHFFNNHKLNICRSMLICGQVDGC